MRITILALIVKQNSKKRFGFKLCSMVADKDNLTAQVETCDSHNSPYPVEYVFLYSTKTSSLNPSKHNNIESFPFSLKTKFYQSIEGSQDFLTCLAPYNPYYFDEFFLNFFVFQFYDQYLDASESEDICWICIGNRKHPKAKYLHRSTVSAMGFYMGHQMK